MYSLPQSYNQTSKCKRCISSNAYEDYPILTFNDINIYKRQENDLSYAIIHNDEVVIIDYPFNYENLEPFFGTSTASVIEFCDMIISANKTKSKEIIIHNDNELSLLMRYYDTIHWSTCINQNKAVIYALSHLFKDGSINENILHWIKTNFNKNGYSVKTEISFNL